MVIGYPYYNSGQELEEIINHFNAFPPDVRNQIRMIVVDDGSPDDPAINHTGKQDFRLTLARIHEDIYNNCSGANNLIMYLADLNEYVLKMDIDYMPAKDSIKELLKNLPHLDEVQFIFYETKADGKGYGHPNIYYVQASTFWKTGGYDEDFSGGKNYSDLILHGLFDVNGIKRINNNVHQMIRLSAPSCNCRKDNIQRNRTLYEKKIGELQRGEYKHGSIFRFNWLIIF